MDINLTMNHIIAYFRGSVVRLRTFALIKLHHYYNTFTKTIGSIILSSPGF